MSKTIIVTEQQLNQIRDFFSENKSLVSSDSGLIEDITIPVTTGDTVMMGRFKNKKTVIKSIDKDKHGMPTINGKQATTFRVYSESKDFVSGEYNGQEFDLSNEDYDAIPFACSGNKVWVGYCPMIGEEFKDAGYKDSNGQNKYPNFHYEINDFYRFIANLGYHDDKHSLPEYSRRDYDYVGRIWLDSGVISFYQYPKDANKMKTIIDLISKEIYNIYGEEFHFGDFLVDTRDDGLVSVSDYVSSDDVSDDVLNSPHLLPFDKKNNNKQFKSALDAKYDHVGKKLGNVTQAEYNHYKRYGMGESKNTLTEITADEVNLSSFKTREELNPKFWESDERIYSRIRRRLLKIADDFIEFIKIDDKFCKDVLLLGSLANYTWSKHSDVDLHILVDFKKVNKNIGFVKDYFDSKRFVWNQDHDDLKIYGFPVEIYVQDVNEVNSSAGIYSLEKNKWIKKPNDSGGEVLDVNKIKYKSADLINKIDELEKDFNKGKADIEKISEKTKKLHDKIKALRKDGLKTKQGEYSVGNIVFKVLRRGGYIEKLIDIKRSSYDKINSLK